MSMTTPSRARPRHPGAPVEGAACPRCAAANLDGNRFCGRCGLALADGARGRGAASAAREGDGGERRNLVIVFADVCDSTAIASTIDAEEWRELLAGYYGVVAAAVDRFGGHVAKYLGDGVLAYFGWPAAHDDDAGRAALAAVAALDGVAALNAAGASRGAPALRARVGIHAGEVVVSPSGEVYGEAPDLAARVQGEAAAGTIALTPSVARAVGRRFAVVDLGERTLRGYDAGMRLFQLAPSVRAASAPPRAPFTGRDAALAELADHWARARAGAGGRVTVTGEPGIGKSRLVAEFRRHVAGAPHVWLPLQGMEFAAHTPFDPVARLLGRIVAGPGARDPVTRLRRLLTRAGLDAATAVDPLAAMLGLAPAAPHPSAAAAAERHQALLRVLVAWILGVARRHPTVVVVEDVHWLDPSTLDLVEAVTAALDDAPLLLLRTARTGPAAAGPAGATIALDRLPEGDLRRIVAALSPEVAARDELVDAIVARADGVPLFAEELALLVGGQPGVAGARAVPETLAGSLNARLDRLGGAREIARVASVVGDAFSPALLGAVLERDPGGLETVFARLVEAGIFAETGAGEAFSHRFKHALIKDAAYGALLRARRRELHARVATALSTAFPALAGGRPELLARHLTAAGRHREAVAAWRRAGGALGGRGAFREAEEAYRNGLANLGELPESGSRDAAHLKLQNALVGVLQITRGYAAAPTAEAAGAARALTARVGDRAQAMTQTAGEWAAASSAGRYLEARALADRFLALARGDGGRDALAAARMMGMTSLYRLGDLAGAERHFAAGRALFDDPGFARRPGAVPQTFGNAARNAWLLGRIGEARARTAHAVAAAERAGRPYDAAFARYMAAIMAALLREADVARLLAEESIALSDAHGFPQFAAISRVALGRALVDLDRAAEGAALIERGIAGMDATGSRVAMTLYLAWLAEARAAGGAVDGALAALDRALCGYPEERFFRPELLRLQGALRAASGDVAAGVAGIRAALASATETGAAWLRLRAATSLHRVLAAAGGDARDAVAAALAAIDDDDGALDAVEAAAIVAGAA